ncbi:hypothetical protein TGGT1_225435 [Toxoplasma gondii GT1]|uniref:Uncharacterized protein n=1 Tax=Toxoplasma gondii (strain ATCC 50853 / GT1) TaxID=507601 RepID=S7UX46_TOXGG|nr:hypothetical protein TGGT1_225435 [Toxoplasma gondii GT1]
MLSEPKREEQEAVTHLRCIREFCSLSGSHRNSGKRICLSSFIKTYSSFSACLFQVSTTTVTRQICLRIESLLTEEPDLTQTDGGLPMGNQQSDWCKEIDARQNMQLRKARQRRENDAGQRV